MIDADQALQDALNHVMLLRQQGASEHTKQAALRVVDQVHSDASRTRLEAQQVTDGLVGRRGQGLDAANSRAGCVQR